MRLLLRSALVTLVLVAAIAFVMPESAHAHGIGGLEPSETTTKVVSVTPQSNDFTIEAIENGERVRLTRTADKTIYVLGVDGELYIQISTQGAFVNKKSATRLINQSTTTNKSVNQQTREYKATSADPNEPPAWEKVSDSNTYSWHDHRTHYMGTVPKGITNLGTNQLQIRVEKVDYVASFEFRSASPPNALVPIAVLLLFVSAVFLSVVFARKKFVSLLSKPLTLIVLGVLAIFEVLHIASYISFSQRTLESEITASIYGLSFIALLIASIYKIIRAQQPWEKTLRIQAPLLSVTGFVGITAGTLIEYRALFEPYPASTLSSDVVRWGIVLVGCLSSLIFAIGVIHIKQENTSALTTT